jgi:hypothetical protein
VDSPNSMETLYFEGKAKWQKQNYTLNFRTAGV